MAIVCSFTTSNNRTKHNHKQNRYTKINIFVYQLNMRSVCPPAVALCTHSRRRCHSPTLLSMNDCSSLCHALTIIRFTVRQLTKLWLW